MRRLISTKDERGAVAVLVAILLVVLLGFAALVVDLGLLYAERAQLRNGADAAAIGIAQSCAENPLDEENCSEETGGGSLAKEMADANALDDQSNADSVTLNRLAGTVSVTTGALEAGSAPNSVSLYFARALGFEEALVSVTSHAAWGVPVGGTAPFAIAFSKCEVDAGNHGDGSLQFLPAHGSKDKLAGCTGSSSGQELPGGFGWLDQTPGFPCGAVIDPDNPWMGSSTGNDIKTDCPARLAEWKTRLESGERVIELLPVFDDKGDTGSHGQLRIHAFAAFDVRGWSFPGAGNQFLMPDAGTYYNDNKLNSSNRGFIGTFVKYVSVDSSYDVAPGTSPYGAESVKLTLGETP